MQSDLDSLLTHADWVHDLARRLVRDPDVAEDLAQDTLVTALRWRGNAIASMRGFLRTVLTNRVREHVRGGHRLQRRELAAAVRPIEPSTADLVARASAQREVVEQVLRLPDIYREALLWRYFEDQTPTQIAARLDVPVSTIKTRLAKAHALLRDELDRRHGGDGRAWVVALAPIVCRTKTAGLSVGAMAAAAIVLVAIGSATAWFWPTRDRAGPPEQLTVALPDPATRSTVEPPRERAEAPADLGERPAWRPSSTAAPMRGRVVDLRGDPVPRIVIKHQRLGFLASKRGTSIAVTGSDGRFKLSGEAGPGTLTTAGRAWMTVSAGVAAAGEITVVVAPRLEVACQVIDEQRRPLDRTSVEVRLPVELEHRLASDLENSWPVPISFTADADGRFTGDLPATSGVRLVARRPGHVDTEILYDGVSRVVELTMASPDPVGALDGRVVDPIGEPVASAWVSDGEAVAWTDELGRFRLPAHDGESRAVTAVAPGWLPGTWTPTSEGEPSSIEIRLTGQRRSIAGLVVDHQGRPLPSARVFVTDPTVFRRHAHDRWSEVPLGYPLADPDAASLVETIGGDASALGVSTSTDAEGWFRLEGLCDRPYTVVAMDEETCVASAPMEVAAGAERVRVVVDLRRVRPTILGRVSFPDGAAAAAATVRVKVRSAGVLHERFSGMVRIAASRTTQQDGRFRIDDAPLLRGSLSISGRGIYPFTIPIADLSDGDEIELRVERSARLALLGSPTSRYDRFVALRDGRPATLIQRRGDATVHHQTGRLVDGRSEIVTVPLATDVLELRGDGVPPRRVPVALVPGQVNTIQF